jgi:hypothetical protein
MPRDSNFEMEGSPLLTRRSMLATKPMLQEEVERVCIRLTDCSTSEHSMDLPLLLCCTTTDTTTLYVALPDSICYPPQIFLQTHFSRSFASMAQHLTRGLRNFQCSSTIQLRAVYTVHTRQACNGPIARDEKHPHILNLA